MSALSAAYEDQSVGIIAGTAPSVATLVKVVGGSADGATATVSDGRFAMWAPGTMLGQEATLQVLDAAGSVIATQSIGGAPGSPPTVPAVTAP